MAPLSPDVNVLVVGAGAMGSGIAHVAALSGHTVYLYDTRPDAPAKGRSGIESDLRFLVGKGRVSEDDAAGALERVVPLLRLQDAKDVGLAIEAIVENLEVKQTLFRELESLLGADAILATNTSSLSVTAIGAALTRPERLVGMHFFNPAPRMKLVEVISGLATDRDVADTLHATARSWGKVPVHALSTPGFIVNRVARPYYAEALRIVGEHAARPQTVDAIMRECCGFPMGPFELMDLIGLDVNFAVTCSVFDAYFGDRRYTPSLLQRELVDAGRLGRKTGRGFYDYAHGAVRPEPQTEAGQKAEPMVTAVGDLGIAATLIGRLEKAGIEVRRTQGEGVAAGPGHGWIRIGHARLELSDGRTATRRAYEEQVPHLVLFDLCLDYAETGRIVLTHADQCGAGAFASVVGTLQQAGLAATRVDDVAGMVGLRTVVMLANEAADGVLQGIGSASDIDTAMRYGTNYPKGPLEWADAQGVAYVARVLANLREHYGEERYRVSPLIQRKAFNGESFHE